MLSFVAKKWEKHKSSLFMALSDEKPCNITYTKLMTLIVRHILNGSITNEVETEWAEDNITKIDNGDYQGTLVYVIHENAYEPIASQYIFTYIDYGSCSGCDALLAAIGYDNEDWEDRASLNDVLTICLHICEHMTMPWSNFDS